MSRTRVAIVAVVVSLVACSSETALSRDKRSNTDEIVTTSPSPVESAAAQFAAKSMAEGERLGREEGNRDAGFPTAIPAGDFVNIMVIRTGYASIELDSLDAGLVLATDLARRLGGYVGGTTFRGGRDQVRQATLEVRVPAEQFDQLVGGLRRFGKVESVNVTAQDVGEEYDELEARAANARQLEQRLIEILRTRTGKLSDVLTVEQELSRVREQIERMQGRLRYLKARSAMSTLSISLHEPLPIGNPGSNPIARALEMAWHNFVNLAAGGIALLGYLVPLGLAGMATVAVWKRGRKATV